jgi:lipopolysaccharide export system permease protein
MKKRWYEIGYQVDRMLISSFLPPFIGSFMMALFVLIMQFMWKFIDDIIGKGVDPLVVMEMFFYKSISLFPLALPIAILLAGVMVMGNLAERYELSSFKSAGVSLTRLLRPLFVVSMLIGLFSFYCSNTIIPLANLKYQSRLYDIRNKKPTLSIEAGVFNEDFRGYAIRVGKKHKDKETIEDIMVYDDTQRNRGQMNVVTAQRGRMYVAEEDGAFVMTLYDGYQYSETESQERPNSLPFTISHFKEWTRKFDLGEFDLDRTEEEQFKSHHLMKSAKQIATEIDTLDEQMEITIAQNQTSYKLFQDTATVKPAKGLQYVSDTMTVGELTRDMFIKGQANINFTTSLKYESIRMMLDTLSVSPDESITENLSPAFLREWKSQLIAGITVQQTSIERNERAIERLSITRRKHVYELHWKFSLSLACVVMLMIGGPMGTIVRKGGFGYPLLISIFFFTFFIMSNISCKKLNDNQTMDPELAAWLPVFLLGAISAFLTYKALNDAKIMDVDRIKSFFSKVFRKRKTAAA